MIDLGLSDKQKKLSAQIETFAKEQLCSGVEQDQETSRFPLEKWKKCGGQKITGLCVEEKYGGAGLNALDTAVAFESLGYANEDGGLNFSLGAHLLACVLPVSLYGSEEQKNKYLPLLCSGQWIACNAMTEPGTGSDAFSMSAAALKTDNQYLINGTKNFVTNALIADLVLLYALTNKEKGFYGGVSAFVVESSLPGIQMQSIRKMGLKTSPMGQMHFHNVKLNEAYLLGKEGAGAGIFSESMLWERAVLASLHSGTIRRLAEECKLFLKKRSALKDQAKEFLVADIALWAESARLMAFRAANSLDQRSGERTLLCSMAKIFCSEALNEASRLSYELYMSCPHEKNAFIERCQCDAPAAKIYSGANEIQKNIIAALSGL